MQQKGSFLTIEGIDGSGKSTAIAVLARKLEGWGKSVLLLREPGGTQIGEEIRSILLDQGNIGMTATCELLLFAAARSELTETVIKPALELGQVVICDRFTDSTVAYQGYGRGINVELIDLINVAATGGLEADRTFLLDLPLETAAERLSFRLNKAGDRLDEEDIRFREKVYAGYMEQFRRASGRIRLIDADRGTEEIVEDMLITLKEDWQL